MIPETDFCAPYFMSTNTTYIEECINADQAKCSGQCKWRKGKVVAANNDLINGADLFGANFCHPPTTENWEKNLPKCITITNKDACAQAKCMWSTGKEFQGENDFCVPKRIPDNAAAFDKCTNEKMETTCLDTCQWFKGTGYNKPINGTGPSTNDTAPVDSRPAGCFPLGSADASICGFTTKETCPVATCFW
jgi:hypothetical protein